MTRKTPSVMNLASVALTILGRISCGQTGAGSDETLAKLRALHAGISFYYQRSEGRLPSGLADVCAREPRWCRLFPADQWVRDGWGTPIRYTPRSEGYLLTSAGRDRTFGTADDMVFDSEEDRRRANAVAGCYLLSHTPSGATSDTLRLSSRVAKLGGHAIDSGAAIDSRALYAEWYLGPADSVVANWIHIDRGGLTLRGVIVGEKLEGRADGKGISARKVKC